MTRLMVAFIIVVLIVGSIRTHQHHRTQPICTEDMSCWNCQTMGNHRCGVQQKS